MRRTFGTENQGHKVQGGKMSGEGYRDMKGLETEAEVRTTAHALLQKISN